ncbi:MAG: ornithine cyclodeaminase family protein [Betaproteobacteria bacterium]|nr:ornithine cyclodeaminase family protein [Betaproteobacteria bacterium]
MADSEIKVVSAAEVERLLDTPELIEALRAMLRSGCEMPPRHHHAVAHPSGAPGTLLLMPAWRAGGLLGLKIVTVFPDNPKQGLPSVTGVYVLSSARTGMPLALMDARVLTLKRTAAASALAASYLARRDAERLLVIGTGALAPYLARAHAAVRPIRNIAVWGRTPAKAEALAANLRTAGLAATAVPDRERAVCEADIVSCATTASTPLVCGAWLKPGAHLDLVGAFTPTTREADTEAVRRARVFVDSRAAALHEAGDIVIPLKGGAIDERHVVGDLFSLVRGEVAGRTGESEITLFKSVGMALEDLAAAELVFDKVRAK